jgi:hypothetical protein
MRSAKAVVVLTTALAGCSASANASVRCVIQPKYSCSPEGCESVKPSVSIRIDPERGTYSRCDFKGCDDYAAAISRSGDFVNVALPERGMLAKVSTSDGGFVEIVTLGLGTLVSYGTCTAAE